MSQLVVCHDKPTALDFLAKKYQAGSNDNLILDSSETIGVADIRQLIKWLSLKSQGPSPRTAIIATAEKLTPEAQNALLKTLEEPPGDAEIILIAPDDEILLPTIISRCQITYLAAKLPTPSPESHKILSLINQNNIAAGFSWAKTFGAKRDEALETLDQLLLAQAPNPDPETTKKLLVAKKHLTAGTNVRLTLENLFL